MHLPASPKSIRSGPGPSRTGPGAGPGPPGPPGTGQGATTTGFKGYCTTKGYSEITDAPAEIDDNNESMFGTAMCGIMSLRRFALFFATVEFCISFISFAGLITDDVRMVAQGYNVKSKTFASMLGLLSVMMCFLYGILGVFDASVERLRIFLYFIGMKIILLWMLFINDILLLKSCGNATLQNPIIQEIQVNNECDKHKIGVWISFALRLIFLTYGCYHSHRLLTLWRDGPQYKINFKRDPLFISYRSFDEASNHLTLDKFAI